MAATVPDITAPTREVLAIALEMLGKANSDRDATIRRLRDANEALHAANERLHADNARHIATIRGLREDAALDHRTIAVQSAQIADLEGRWLAMEVTA